MRALFLFGVGFFLRRALSIVTAAVVICDACMLPPESLGGLFLFGGIAVGMDKNVRKVVNVFFVHVVCLVDITCEQLDRKSSRRKLFWTGAACLWAPSTRPYGGL